MSDHPLISNVNEQDTFQTFGGDLKRARTEQRRSLDDVASATKIHRRHLEAIEAGDISQLPQGPYVKAFLREYARVVGLTVPDFFASPANPSNKDPRVVSRPVQAANAILDSEVLPIASVAKETARMANTAVNSAVKTVAKTTESVVKFVETGSKDALELLTSKSLWEEADEVRRERMGLPPIPKRPEPVGVPIAPTVMEASASSAAAPKAFRPISERTSPKLGAPSSPVIPERFSPELATEPEGPLAPPKRTSSKGTTNVVIALLVLLFGGAAFFALRSNRRDSAPSEAATKNYIPAPLDKPQPISTPKVSVPTVTAATTPGTPGPKDSLSFSVRATEPVWVSIASDGFASYKGEMKAGESRSFKAGQKFIVNLGNQKAVAMNFDGQSLSNLPTIKNSGIVVRNLILTRDHVSLGGQDLQISTVPAQVPSSPAVPTPMVSTPNAQTTPGLKGAKSVSPANQSSATKPKQTAGSKNIGSPKHSGSPSNNSVSKNTNPSKISTPKSGPAPQKRLIHSSSKPGQITPLDPLPARP